LLFSVLTTDAAFGYSVLFSVVGMVIGTLLAVIIYKVLLITGRLSFVILGRYYIQGMMLFTEIFIIYYLQDIVD
jgi:hypothetical protein